MKVWNDFNRGEAIMFLLCWLVWLHVLGIIGD